MVYNQDNSNLDWQRNLKSTAKPIARGSQVLVNYTLRKNENAFLRPSTTRCVWPGSILTNESKVFSRRLTIKA